MKTVGTYLLSSQSGHPKSLALREHFQTFSSDDQFAISRNQAKESKVESMENFISFRQVKIRLNSFAMVRAWQNLRSAARGVKTGSRPWHLSSAIALFCLVIKIVTRLPQAGNALGKRALLSAEASG